MKVIAEGPRAGSGRDFQLWEPGAGWPGCQWCVQVQPGPEAEEEAGIRVETPRADWTREVGNSGPRGWAVTSDLWAGRHCSLGRMHAGPSHSHTQRHAHRHTCTHTHVHVYRLERKPRRKEKNPVMEFLRIKMEHLARSRFPQAAARSGRRSGLRVS